MFVSEEEILSFISQINASGVLGKSKRRATLLEHLIRAEANGQGDALKAYSIGLDVLGKKEDFDPSTDSIVRVEVGRLRDALALFDASASSSGQVHVKIPKGTYRPVFSERQGREDSNGDAADQAAKLQIEKSRFRFAQMLLFATLISIGIGVFAFKWVDTKPDRDVASIRVLLSTSKSASLAESSSVRQFTLGLKAALSKIRALVIVQNSPKHVNSNIDYTLEIGALGGQNPYRITMELVDASDGAIQWAESFSINNESQIDIAVGVAVRELYPQIISSSKDVLDQRDVNSLNAWELYLLSTWVPGTGDSSLGWEIERVKLAERAIKLDPKLGEAYSVLADKLAYLSSVDARYHSTEIETMANQRATQALGLAPRSVGTLFNVSIHKWHLGKVSDATELAKRTLEIDPHHGLAQLLSVLYPYTCVQAPDRILKFAQEFDAQLSPDNPVRWVVLTWIAKLHLNRGEYELAEQAESRSHNIFHTPDSVVRHAVTLHALGRNDDAFGLVKDQLMNWPNLDPEHFAKVTLPRRCQEYPKAKQLLDLYSQFANAYRNHL